MNAMLPQDGSSSGMALLGRAENASMDLSQMAGALWRAKGLLTLCATVGAIAGLLWALLVSEPRYRAMAVVVLSTGADQVVSFTDFLPSLGADQSVVNTELEMLRSASLLSDLAGAEGLVDDPEFNRYLSPPSLLWQGINSVKAALLPPDPAPHPDTIARRNLNATIAGISDALIVRTVPDSLVFEVVFETGNAEKSARLANALVDHYLRRQLDAKFASTQAAAGWLTEKVAGLEIELQTAESRMSRFAAEMELISPDTVDVLTTDLKTTRDSIAALDAATVRGEARRNSAARIVELRNDEAALAAKIEDLTEDRVVLDQLQREAAASRTIYEYFLARLKETTVQQGIQTADARLMSAALVPDVPSAPRPVLMALLCATLAGFAAAALAVGWEMRTATFRTAEALERATGLPVLGQIPQIPARRRQGVLDYIRAKPASAAVEAIRNLRTSLVMSGGQKPPQVILSTSSLPSEGKTTQTLALAQTFTGLGRRVLVIEGDVRKRVFRDYFGAPDCGSLLRVLSGKQTLQGAVWHNDALGFDVLFGDDGGANAADIFSSTAFRRLIDQARADYDIVLIDTPPVLLVPDARVIGRLVDAVLYTVRWDKTREKQVQAGLRAFQTVGIPVTGLVLSQISPKGMKRYGYGKDYGTYGSSGYYAN